VLPGSPELTAPPVLFLPSARNLAGEPEPVDEHTDAVAVGDLLPVVAVIR
jgi:hypothetical protein